MDKIIIIPLIILIILVILIIFIYEYDLKAKDIERHKCFKIYRELYPQTKFCPGKESETLCYKCKYYTKNNSYKVDLIADDEKEIKGLK